MFCQNGNKQQEYLRLLGKHANGVFVNTSSCITLAATILRCELNSSSLIIDPAGTTVALDGVDIRLCLCDSSVSVVYYLTNETNITVDCTQCPFRLTEGGLELDHSIMVFKKERDGRNETNVGIVVRWLNSDEYGLAYVLHHNLYINQTLILYLICMCYQS